MTHISTRCCWEVGKSDRYQREGSRGRNGGSTREKHDMAPAPEAPPDLNYSRNPPFCPHQVVAHFQGRD